MRPLMKRIDKTIFPWFWFLVVLNLIISCNSDVHEGKSVEQKNMTNRDINEVIEAHTGELMSLPGVVGTYIGALDDSTLCIKVMVIKKTPALEEKIPKMIEGYRILVEETGEIRPLPEE